MALPASVSLATLARLLLGLVVVLFAWSRAVFPLEDVDVADRGVAAAGLLLVWLILGGYAAAAVDVLGTGFVVAWLLVLWLVVDRGAVAQGPAGYVRALPAVVVTNLRRLGGPAIRLAQWAERAARTLVRPGQRPRRVPARIWLGAAALGVVVVASAWLRFAFNLDHAGLLYSDSLETVAWIKLLLQGQVFPNGVYPFGMYITVSELVAITHASALPAEKFFGPLVGVLMVASAMWTSYRMGGGRLAPALAAGIVYGLLPALLPYTAPRQAATDAQEFGNVFVLPLAWLTFQSWRTGTRGYALAAAGLLALLGLVHPVALFNGALGALAGTLAAWSVGAFSRDRLRRWLGLIAGAAVVAVAPLAVGLATGGHLISTGVAFLQANAADVVAPPLGPATLWAAGGALALLVARLFVRRHRLSDIGVPLTGLFFLVLAVLVQQAPRFGLRSVVLAARSGELVALVDALDIGLGVAAVGVVLDVVTRPAVAGVVACVLTVAVGSDLAYAQSPRPFAAYRMTSDAYVVAFQRIADTLPPDSWLAVADQGYAFVLGQGYNLEPEAWAQAASTASAWPDLSLAGASPAPLTEPYLFLFDASGPVAPTVDDPAEAAATRAQRHALAAWVRAWERRHGPMPVYLRAPGLTVYWLRQPRPARAPAGA